MNAIQEHSLTLFLKDNRYMLHIGFDAKRYILLRETLSANL